MQHSRTLLKTTCLTAALLCAWPFYASANPQGGSIAAGQATFSEAGKKLDIHQQSSKVVIDWRGFDIAPDEHTQFHQPGSSSIALNRVNSTSASHINGKLTANGNVVIVNQNGVVFGPGSRVDVNGLVATTADIDNDQFMHNATLAFDKKGNAGAAIINQGIITAKDAGLVGFVAPSVVNDGIITTKMGRVHLASGDTAAVDMYGDGLMRVAVSNDVKSQLVANRGLIEADGGTIALTAAAGSEIVNSLILSQGALKSQSVGVKNGEIIITAEGSNKTKKQGNSHVVVEGMVDASGRDAAERGGAVTITADEVTLLDGTLIDASGHTGLSGTTAGKLLSDHRVGSAGGDIRIGGDYLGQGDTPTAKNLYVSSGALILNDSLYEGDAGRTIFWSDDTTQFYGNVYARALGGKAVNALTWNATAGGNAGDGGFVETSGYKHLDAGGYVDLTASAGNRGTYFLDPTNITIYGNVDPAFVSTDSSLNLASSLRLWLDASDANNVTLTYSTDALSGATATGTSGANTLTTSVDVASQLAVGARIRLGGTGSVAAASTLGADTYTIASISGTTITLTSNLTQNYSASSLHRGLVSQLNDKSGQNNNATQTIASRMPLWISSGSGTGTSMQYDGNDWLSFANTNVRAVDIVAKWANTTGGFRVILGGDDYPFHGDVAGGQLVNGGNSAIAVNNAAKYVNGLLTSGLLARYTQDTIHFFNTTGAISVNNISMDRAIPDRGFLGNMYEVVLGSDVMGDASRNLLEQYQSAKWGIALTPPGTGANEVAKATAADGYSVFTTRYLERLSQSANVSLQATNNITLDLKGDTLNFATAGRSLTMNAGNNITTASTGAIATNNGAINLTGTNGILFSHAMQLNSNGGDITFNNATTLNANLTTNSGSGTTTFASTVDGSNNLTATAGTFSFASAIGGTTPLAAVSLTSANSLTLPSISAASILARTTGASADITIPNTRVLTASGAGNSLTLVSERNFINNHNASALSAPNGRWIVYSKNAASNIAGGLTAPQMINEQTFGSLAPAAITTPTYNATQNTWVYSDALPTGTLRFTANNFNRFYGDVNPVFTYSFWCSTGCTVADAVTGAPTLSTAATQGSNVGSFAIVIAQGTLAKLAGYAGYTFDFVDGLLTVDPRLVTTAFPGVVIPNTVTIMSQIPAVSIPVNSGAEASPFASTFNHSMPLIHFAATDNDRSTSVGSASLASERSSETKDIKPIIYQEAERFDRNRSFLTIDSSLVKKLNLNRRYAYSE